MSKSDNNKHQAEDRDILTERFLGGNRVLGVIIGIIMIIFGILFIVRPLQVAMILDIIATLGFLLYGIYQIVCYVRSPAQLRSGWQLAFGIVWILMAILILASGGAGIIVTFAFLLGFLAVLSGFMQVSLYSAIRGQSGAGLILASAIINILLGVAMLILPFFAAAVVAIAQGIYLIVAGLALILEALSGHSHKVA
jgi:uncharacterized membrane protein HdeD (DUF308 family)